MFLHVYREVRNQCATEKGFIMTKVSGSNGVNQTTSVQVAEGVEAKKSKVRIWDSSQRKFLDEMGTQVEKKEVPNKTTTTASFTAQLTPEEARYLQEKGLISGAEGSSYNLKLSSANASQEEIEAAMNNVKAALSSYNSENNTLDGLPEQNETRTLTEEELSQLPEDHRALLSGKMEITSKQKRYDITVNTSVTTESDYGAPLEAEVKAADLNRRSDRKAIREKYESSLEQWVANPENEETMTVSIAAKRYAKKIDKAAAKLEKEYAGREAKLVEDFFGEKASIGGADENAKNNYKAFMAMADDALFEISEKDLISNIEKAQADGADDDTKAKGLQASKTMQLRAEFKQYLRDNNVFYDDIKTNPDVRKGHLRAFYAQSIGVDNLIRNAAYTKVMNDRSDKTKASDQKDFVKYMSKREVQKDRDEQNMANTTLFLSKDDAKKAEAEWKRNGKKPPQAQFKFVGKAGLKMIENRPDLFCVEAKPGEKADFTRNGKSYKFDTQHYSDKIGEYFDNGGENHHATLDEIRDIAGENGNKIFLDSDSEIASYEQAFGNGNGKVGYREGRKLRTAIEATGRSVDKDYTNWIRTRIIAQGAVIGAGTAVLTHGLANVLGSELSGTVQSAAQTVAGQVLKTPARTTHVTVNGRDYSVTVPGETLKADDTTVPGQDVPYSDKPGFFNGAGPVAGLGALMGAAAAYQKAMATRAKSDTDDLVNLRPKNTLQASYKDMYTDSQITGMKKTVVDIKGNNTYSSIYANEADIQTNLLGVGLGANGEDRDKVLMKARGVDVAITQEVQLEGAAKNRAQYVMSYVTDGGQKIDVTPSVGKDGKLDYKHPTKVVLHDATNGEEHVFTYDLQDRQATLDQYASQAKNLSNYQDAIYKLSSVTLEDGTDISDPDKHVELKGLNVVPHATRTQKIQTRLGEIEVEVLGFDYNFFQDENFLGVGAGHTSILNSRSKAKNWNTSSHKPR